MGTSAVELIERERRPALLDHRRVRARMPEPVAALCAASAEVPDRYAFSRQRGWRWLGGLAVDVALGRPDVLLVADVYADRFVGLFDRSDWTAEVGARRQMGRHTVLDAAVGRHFSGVSTAWLMSLGLTRTLQIRPVRRG